MKPRKHIEALQPYEGEITVLEIARRLRTGPERIAKAEFNESPYAPPPFVREAWRRLITRNDSPYGRVNTYPYEIHYEKLRRKLALKRHRPLKWTNVLLGNGSNEIIDLAVRAFLEPGRDRALLLEPAFGGYRVYLETYKIGVDRMTCGADLRFDLGEIDRRLKRQRSIRAVFVCNPNNPTGEAIDRLDLMRLVRKHPRVLWLVDEAYVEFAPPAISVAKHASAVPNLIVARTFSKAWGLAGLRIGYAVSRADNVRAMSCCRVSYTANIFAIVALDQMLDRPEHLRSVVRRIMRSRESLREALETLPCVEWTHASHGNFVLVRFKDAEKAFRRLLQHGVIVRNYSDRPRMENCLRITIGDKTMNKRVVDALRTLRT